MKLSLAYRIKVAAVAGIVALGLALTVGMLYAGTNDAAGLFATPVPPVADEEIVLPASVNGEFQDARTLVLEPTIHDIVSDTWPVRQDDVYVNLPSGFDIPLPTDVYSVSYGAPGGSISRTGSYILHVFSVGPEGLVTVTYHTRSRVVRYGNVVTVTARAGSSWTMNPLTCTIVYTRYFPEGAPANYWGDANPQLQAKQILPPANDMPPGSVRWITTTTSFVGMVVLSEPMFGSNITITDFTMVPADPVYGQNVNFTVTVKNTGVMTAWRGFANEVYLKPSADPPPANAFDHGWGIIVYQGDALFHKPGFPGDWPVNFLGPGESVTLTTGITLVGGIAAGSLQAYAQADTGYEGDSYRYAWYGSNIEGYGFPPYTEEKNVTKLSHTFFMTIPGRVFLPSIFK